MCGARANKFFSKKTTSRNPSLLSEPLELLRTEDRIRDEVILDIHKLVEAFSVIKTLVIFLRCVDIWDFLIINKLIRNQECLLILKL